MPHLLPAQLSMGRVSECSNDLASLLLLLWHFSRQTLCFRNLNLDGVESAWKWLLKKLLMGSSFLARYSLPLHSVWKSLKKVSQNQINFNFNATISSIFKHWPYLESRVSFMSILPQGFSYLRWLWLLFPIVFLLPSFVKLFPTF